eukprot:TRINITY_DN7929_c0_g2_i14.p1 TRINITY_DN7929_c0_g2~~TRINITY_DN7929_c0_g2_i14.p1  ORF type:complete len:191 (-),score=30.79 TRINITY_DN7929_c0_g2_i14:796-1368(-)
MITFNLFIEEVKKKKPDIVFWIGDSAPNTDSVVEGKDKTRYFKRIAEAFREAEFVGKVYGVLGSHECYPPSQFNVFNESEERWLTEEFAKALKHWYTEDAYNTTKKYGYFSQLYKNTKLRIIGLNTQANDYKNVYLISNATDPLRQIAWLEQELSKSEVNHESVMILGHVGPQSLRGATCNCAMTRSLVL